MISKIHIKNFKSINDLELNVSRVNLFIGENGSGKSNLLEALVFASAVDSEKLDNEFLVSRGLRVTEPTLMRSAFNKETKDKNIEIDIECDNKELKYVLKNNNDSNYPKWDYHHQINSNFHKHSIIEKLNKLLLMNSEDKENMIPFYKSLSEEEHKGMNSLVKDYSFDIKGFLIYSPENTALRNFYKEGQIEPLGINGEGLLKLIKVINNYEDPSYINTIKKTLELFNWFESIDIPKDLSSSEDKVVIQDKFLYKEFDQRSANEGFLFILFYITLVVAKETPKAFAIDNIDASLNPKLCTKLITILTELAKKYDKQIFLTTHNPAILDGMNLNDEEQKLFAVSRNKKGHTRLKEITTKDNPVSDDGESLHLSEAFLRGYLGGLPKGF